MAPLLSVLLPTRNRLDLLQYAVRTVLNQDDPDWEIVVSDNQSEDDVAGWVKRLADDRVRYVATKHFVPVTDNWNHALEQSRGDYVVMLGDDDGLMPGFVGRLRELASHFGQPDAIYQSAWLYAHPGVFPEHPGGYVKPYGYADFLRGRNKPFLLGRKERRLAVENALDFRMSYGFNMQFWTVSRGLLDRMSPRGPFYQGAFPDYYASNALMLAARSIFVEPRPLVVIGVSPKSYGYFHATADERGGKAFLEAKAQPSRRRTVLDDMPGTNINTGWLSALRALAHRYPDLLPARVSARRFRALQALFVYERRARGEVSADEVREMEDHLPAVGRAAGRTGMVIATLLGRVLPPRAAGVLLSGFRFAVAQQHAYWDPPALSGQFPTLDALFEADPPYPRTVYRGLRQRLRNTTV